MAHLLWRSVGRYKVFFVSLLLCLYVGLGWGTQPGVLVFLNGTSSAGKSSVARALMARVNEKVTSPFLYESLDDFNTRKESAFQAEQDEQDDADDDMEDVDDERDQQVDSGFGGSEKVSQKDNDDDDDSQVDYLEYLKERVESGSNIIGDTVLRDKDDMRDYQKIFAGYPRMIFALVFCPLRKISQRVDARNRSGNKDEERSLYQAVWQFAHMFKVTPKRTSRTIDSYTRKDLSAVFRILKKEMILENKTKKEKGEELIDIDDELAHFQTALAPKKGNRSFLEPLFHHDIVVINQGEYGAQKAAGKIAEVLEQRYKTLFNSHNNSNAWRGERASKSRFRMLSVQACT